MHKNWFVMARAIALLVFLVSGAWGACANLYTNCSGLASSCSELVCYDGSTLSCPWDFPYRGGVSSRTCNGGDGYFSANVYVRCCNNQCQSDSLRCVNDGKEWTTIAGGTCNGKGCKVSNCTADDTAWLDSAKAACQSIQGTNDFAIVDTNDVCEHRGHCCALDSLIDGEGCKWRCLSQDSLCTLKKGNFSYAIVADTAVSGSDTTYTGLCYNNCFMHASKDGKTGLVTGNSVMSQTSDPISAGFYYPDGFKGVRSEAVGIYTYDFLSDENYEWADSLLSAPCSVGMYRGVKNGKYVYWKSGQPVPAGVTNVVKVK